MCSTGCLGHRPSRTFCRDAPGTRFPINLPNTAIDLGLNAGFQKGTMIGSPPRGPSGRAGGCRSRNSAFTSPITMAETLKVEKRKSFGKRNNERLRRAGRLPAVLYGHGEECVSLTLASDQFETSLRHGAKVVDLHGDAEGKALLQDVQWDVFYQQVLHVD